MVIFLSPLLKRWNRNLVFDCGQLQRILNTESNLLCGVAVELWCIRVFVASTIA